MIIEVPHFAALRDKEREIVILRSDNGENWKEHTVDLTEDTLNEVFQKHFEADGKCFLLIFFCRIDHRLNNNILIY